MWLAVDLKKLNTIGAVKLVGYAPGGLPATFGLSRRLAAAGPFEDVMVCPDQGSFLGRCPAAPAR